MSLVLFASVLSFATLAAAVDEWDFKETRAVQLRYGECVVKKKAAAARDFVMAPDLEKSDFRRLIQKVGDGECLIDATESRNVVQMQFPMDTMRYALADALVRKEFSSVAPASLKNAQAIIQPDFDESKYQPKPGKKLDNKQLEKLAKDRTKRLALVYLAEYGECVVREEASKSRALLLANPDTPEEAAAFTALKPALGNCVSEGQSLTFNKMTIRGTIAMNYYRLAHAPRVATASGAQR